MIDDYLSGLSNGSVDYKLDFIDLAEAVKRLDALGPCPVRINRTTEDMRALLAPLGVACEPNEMGIWPLAKFGALPVFYGERSEIVMSDGTARPLREAK